MSREILILCAAGVLVVISVVVHVSAWRERRKAARSARVAWRYYLRVARVLDAVEKLAGGKDSD